MLHFYVLWTILMATTNPCITVLELYFSGFGTFLPLPPFFHLKGRFPGKANNVLWVLNGS